MIRRPPRSTRTDTLFPTRRSSDLTRRLPPNVLTIIATLALIGVPVVLIAKQPDLGTALLIVAAGGFALFLGGLRWRWIIGAFALAGAAAPLLWSHMQDYQRQRILTQIGRASCRERVCQYG